jgi:hypothetical protein
MWSILPALIAGLASNERRAHTECRLANECLVASHFGLIGFYSTLLVAAELRERDKNEIFALIGLSLFFAVLGLFVTRSIDKRVQKSQPHTCSPECCQVLTFRAKLGVIGGNVVLCVIALVLAGCVTFSGMVVRDRPHAPTSQH